MFSAKVKIRPTNQSFLTVFCFYRTVGTEKYEAAAGPNDGCFQHHAAIDAEAAAAAKWAAAQQQQQNNQFMMMMTQMIQDMKNN